jgi:F-type H+-transporting ATPase subunit b
MGALFAFLAQVEHPEEVSEPADLYPHLDELIVAALAFLVVFLFMQRFVIPRLNQTLEARRQKIQGDLEEADRSRREAEELLSDYRRQLSGARDEANRIIEEARQSAEQMRRDLEGRAQDESRAIVERAQEEIRAERDRVFQELKTQVGELSLALAGRMVGESLDPERHLRMVDEYINDLSSLGSGTGNGHGGGSGAEPPAGGEG